LKPTTTQDSSDADCLTKPVKHTAHTGMAKTTNSEPQKIKCHRQIEESISQSSSLSVKGHEMCFMAKENKKKTIVSEDKEEKEDYDFDFDKLNKKYMIKIKNIFQKVQEQELLLEQQEEFLIGKIEELKTLNEEHEKLKHSTTTLIAQVEEENANIMAQLEVLTSKHVEVQNDHEKLKCSHENLQDALVMLQVSHEVVVTSVKHFQPLTQKCTCSLESIDFICANACYSQSHQSIVEQIHVEPCDDFIAQENDQLKLEVRRLELEMVKLKGKVLVQPTQDNRDHMVNKLESGTTVVRLPSQQKYKSPHHKRQEKAKKDLKHIKCFKCSDMGHYVFMCSAKVESKIRLSRRQRRLLRTIRCFGCKKEGHKVMCCPNFQKGQNSASLTGQTGKGDRSGRSMTGSAHKKVLDINSRRPGASRKREGLERVHKKEEKDHMSKVRRRICYTCRLKGHLSQDCPKGKKSEPKVANSSSNVHIKTNFGYDTRELISSPCTSPKAIWVPKSLLTNLGGPNKT
jgi:hypothetical protein